VLGYTTQQQAVCDTYIIDFIYCVDTSVGYLL